MPIFISSWTHSRLRPSCLPASKKKFCCPNILYFYHVNLHKKERNLFAARHLFGCKILKENFFISPLLLPSFFCPQIHFLTFWDTTAAVAKGNCGWLNVYIHLTAVYFIFASRDIGCPFFFFFFKNNNNDDFKLHLVKVPLSTKARL